MAVGLFNHTAISFPLLNPRDVYREPLPSGAPSAMDGMGNFLEWFRFWYGEPQLHRFRLEVKNSSAWPIERVTGVYAVVNGQRNRMTLARKDGSPNYYGSMNWHWDSPECCRSEYVYGFEVETRGLFKTRRVKLPIQGTFRARVSMFGRVSWFYDYQDATASGAGELSFDMYHRDGHFFLQNLSPRDVTWTATLSGPDPQLFSVQYDGPEIQGCGDIGSILVLFDYHASMHPPQELPRPVRQAFLDLVARTPGNGGVLLHTRLTLYGDPNPYGA